MPPIDSDHGQTSSGSAPREESAAAKPTARVHLTRPEDRLTWQHKAAYGIGAVVLQAGNNSIQAMANVIFNIEMGVSLALIGIAMMIFRLYDAFLDPFMGNYSDNTHTRWGRRRPYMFIGAILSAVSFPFIWMAPAGMSEMQIFSYFVGTSILFYTCFTVFVVPYETLSAELSPDYHERTSVVAFRSFFGLLSMIFVGWVFAITQLPIFESTIQGMRWTAVVIALLFLVMGLIPAIFCRERINVAQEKQRQVGFAESLKLSLKNRAFLMVLGALVFITVGNNLVQSLGQYLNIYYVFGGAKEQASMLQGHFTTITLTTSFLTIPLAIWFSRRYGKRRLILTALGFSLFANLSKWFLITPDQPNLQLVLAFFLGLGGPGFWIGLVSMLGDVADQDELDNATRREGSFTSIYTWVFKFALAITLFLGNLTIQFTGFELDLGGAQSPETYLAMRIVLVAVTSFAILAAIWFIYKYPITEDKAYATRDVLDKRRGTA